MTNFSFANNDNHNNAYTTAPIRLYLPDSLHREFYNWNWIQLEDSSFYMKLVKYNINFTHRVTGLVCIKMHHNSGIYHFVSYWSQLSADIFGHRLMKTIWIQYYSWSLCGKTSKWSEGHTFMDCSCVLQRIQPFELGHRPETNSLFIVSQCGTFSCQTFLLVTVGINTRRIVWAPVLCTRLTDTPKWNRESLHLCY